jgi:hypothetical protein
MTFLAPLWLGVGVAAALGVLALHFIARMRPAPMLLPTARFVPDLPARAASRAPRPTDLLLLVLRAAAALLLGLAFAGPIAQPSRVSVARIVMLDRSAAVSDHDAAEALARSELRENDVLVPFDTTAAPVRWTSAAAVPEARQAPGDLTAALLVALREARELAPRADSVELVLISPVDEAEWSSAVLPVRAEWAGGIRIERIAGAAGDSSAAFALRAADDDPLGATAALLGAADVPSARVRLVRDAPSAADSQWAVESGGALVHWPREVVSTAPDSSAPASGAGAVITLGTVAVAPWLRGASPEGRPVAWWADGGVAAAERTLGAGCVRKVEVGVPEAGDVVLAASTQRVLRALTAPCGMPGRLGPVADSLVARLAGADGMVAGSQVVRAGAATSRATPWLIVAALVLLLIEMLVRRRRVSS